jgi:hypothetical protein
MNNPEFKRNLWLSFSMHRLIAMPALLALTLLATALTDRDKIADSLYSVAIGLFIFTVWLWGGRSANATIVDELRDKTWDQQRMSSLDPWTMTWGKLFGATSFNWYGGLMCLLVIAASGISAQKPNLFATLLTLIAVGVMLHAALIALNLHASQFESRLIQRGGMGWLAILLVLMLIPAFDGGDATQINWWGMQVGHANFWLVSTLLFAACATFAAWRVVCNALQVRTLPWAWPAFACLLTFYLAGFAGDGDRIQSLLISGLIVCGAMTYASLASEPNTLLKWRRLQLLAQNGNWRGWLENLPLWPTTLALALLAGLLIPLTSRVEITDTLGIDILPSHYALTFALMILRDACILLFFAFAPGSKRAIGTTLLYLFLLDMLLPYLAEIAGLDAVRYLLLPYAVGNSAWSGALIMLVHTGIAIWLINRRLSNEKPL